MEHHTIIITGTQSGKLNRGGILVYTLIIGRVLETFMSSCKVEYTTVDVVYAARKLRIRTYRILERGWLGVFEREHLVVKGCTPYQMASDPSQEEILPVTGCSLTHKKLLPVFPYTDEELMNYMDKAGLGTISIRTNTLRMLLEREYTRYSGKYVVPTLKRLFPYETTCGMKVVNASLTSGWETELARIERGEFSQGKSLDGVLRTVNKVTGEISRNRPVEKRPQGTAQTNVKAGKTGEVQTICPYFFFICARYVSLLLSGKGLGLPRFYRKAAPFRGLVG